MPPMTPEQQQAVMAEAFSMQPIGKLELGTVIRTSDGQQTVNAVVVGAQVRDTVPVDTDQGQRLHVPAWKHVRKV